MTPDPQRVAEVVRRHILTAYRPDSCIASTRAVIDVLAYFGETARPWPARALAWNTLAANLTAGNMPMDLWPDAAHSVGIAGEGRDRPGTWDGHLVALTGTHLYDVSLDQMARPEKGIRLGPVALELPADWDGKRLVAPLRGGGVLGYEGISDDGWRSSPNWRRTPTIRRVIGAAIRELRGDHDE